MPTDIHSILAHLPFENEPQRRALLTGWQRYCIDYARLCILDGRTVPETMIEELERAVWHLDVKEGE